MKCPNCAKEFEIKIGSKIISKNVKVLTAMTTIVTVQCLNCKQMSQIPITSKSFISVKKDEEKDF